MSNTPTFDPTLGFHEAITLALSDAKEVLNWRLLIAVLAELESMNNQEPRAYNLRSGVFGIHLMFPDREPTGKDTDFSAIRVIIFAHIYPNALDQKQAQFIFTRHQENKEDMLMLLNQGMSAMKANKKLREMSKPTLPDETA